MNESQLQATRRLTMHRGNWIALALSLFAAACLLISASLPWWGLIMYAPQYPAGLTILSTLRDMHGDVTEINGLNHYIGLMEVDKAAQIERALVPYMLAVASTAVVAASFVRGKAAWWLRLPLALFPLVFLIDLQTWLWYAGNHLDPAAALSASIKAFTPRMLGEGRIAQFVTYGWVETGFWLGMAGSVLAIAAAWLQGRLKPRLPEG